MVKLNLVHVLKTLFPVFLLPMFFLLHAINENYGLIPHNVIFQLALLYILITASIIAFSLFLLKNAEKAVVFSFYLLSVFFLFGAFHDFLKSSIHNQFLVSYSLLVPLLFLITVVFFMSVRRRKKTGTLSITYFQYLVTVFVLLEIVALTYNEITNKRLRNNLSGEAVLWSSKNKCFKESKPDIFFIIFDGYTSSRCLREEFDYDNSEIDSLLIAHRFFISKSSRSNYNSTPFSLSSTLNLSYLMTGVENKPVTNKTFMQAIETLRENHLMKFLRENGYNIKNYGCFEMDKVPNKTDAYFKDLYYTQIDNQTFSSRLWRDIGWNFTLKNILTGSFRIPESYTKSKAYHLYRNNYNLNGLINEVNTKSNTPRFVYAHLILPHEPFYLDSGGKMISDTAILLNKIALKQGYLNQVKYCNSLLKQLIPLVSTASKSGRVVIIQGDHGFRNYESHVPRYKDFMNLNAYYFSDGDYSQLYDGISPVNSFRVISNKYFCQSFPLLKDSSVYLSNEKNAF